MLQISVSITIKVWDYYDFEPSGSALGGYDIYDATWYRFATIGFAKPFNVNGQYRMDVFIIPE